MCSTLVHMELLQIDREILVMIDRLRTEHQACTGAAVAQMLKMSRTYIFQRCSLLREAGHVTWTQMPGSLRLVATPTVSATEPATPTDRLEPVTVNDSETEPTGPNPTPVTGDTRVTRNDPAKRGRPRKAVPPDLNHPYSYPKLPPDKNVKQRSKSSGIQRSATVDDGNAAPNADNQSDWS